MAVLNSYELVAAENPCLTFPFDISVTHLELGGGVGCAPGLVQDRVVEAGVPQLHTFLVPAWSIGEDVGFCWKTDIFLRFDSQKRSLEV